MGGCRGSRKMKLVLSYAWEDKSVLYVQIHIVNVRIASRTSNGLEINTLLVNCIFINVSDLISLLKATRGILNLAKVEEQRGPAQQGLAQ